MKRVKLEKFKTTSACPRALARWMQSTVIGVLIALGLLFTSVAGAARVLKFEGVPPNQILTLKKRFPQAFERSVSLSEVDAILRYLMTTKGFANIEVLERGPADQREWVLMASLVRRISDIEIKGNKQVNRDEILSILGIAKGQSFERKDLVAASEVLQERYGNLGFLNAKIEIDFALPSDTEVKVNVSISEGPPCRITEVNFETPNKDIVTRAQRLARTLLQRPMSETNVLSFQKDLSDYFSQNRYLTARLSQPAITYNSDRSQAKLTYLIESAYKYEFLFDGIAYYEPGSILRQIDLDKLAGLTTSPAADLADRIRKLYQNNGFPNIEVEYKEKIFEESQRYQIRFEIKEGKRVRIRKIEIAGNVSRPPAYYAKFISTHSSELVEKGYYNRAAIETGYENLKVELQNQGFIKARVQSVRTEYDKEREFATIFINIDEGPLTQIRQLKFEGVEAFSKAHLSDIMQMRAGTPLSLNELTGALGRLKEFYMSQGYLEMRILNERTNEGPDALVTYNDTNTNAVIQVQIHEGPKVTVSSIAVVGNTFTKDYVILRELEFGIGDTLTPTKIEDSIIRLQRMSLFSKVTISTSEAGTDHAERTVVVEVIDRDPGLFTSGIGVTTETGGGQRGVNTRGYLGIAYRNLGGTARAISGRVSVEYSTDPAISYLENEVNIGYLEPYIFGGRNRGRVNLTRTEEFSAEEQSTSGDNRIVIQERNTIAFLAERDLTRHLKWTQTLYSFSNQRKFNRHTKDTLESQNIAKVGPTIDWDHRDNPFVPRRGFFASASAEYSDPVLGSSDDRNQRIRFTKLLGEFTHFWKPWKSSGIVWENTIRSGYVANLSNKANSFVPATEIFFLGGQSTIRGFDFGDLGRIPNVHQLNEEEPRFFKLRNDSSYHLFKSDLRLPVYGEFVDFVLFYDGGAVLINQAGVDIRDPYRDSTGVGLRFNSPVGSLRLDVGFKLDRQSFGPGQMESAHAIHLRFGTN
ncbi:MAG: FtsQ-type POTRA domain-containing protein [Bdellovibrionaceae bacterium]|nr:FtsQ-type POTRA domain-containing protein [Pseudobdellovibrionaceae bacterium]